MSAQHLFTVLFNAGIAIFIGATVLFGDVLYRPPAVVAGDRPPNDVELTRVNVSLRRPKGHGPPARNIDPWVTDGPPAPD